MTSTGLKDRVNEITKCSICLDVFNLPRSLPCLHTFCHECIKKHCADINPGDTGSCPLCRTEFQITEKGVDSLPHNFFIQDLIEVKKLTMADSASPVICEGCSEDASSAVPATVFCVDCNSKLCEPCSRPHKRFRGGGHKIVPLGAELTPEHILSQGSYCEIDTDELVKMYCLDCNKNICVVCFAVSHQQHKCEKIEVAAEEFRKQMKADAPVVSSRIAKIKDEKKLLESKKTNFVEDIAKIAKDIKSKGVEIKKLIDSQVDQLLKELDVVKLNATKDIAAQIDILDTAITSMESFSNYSQELQSKGKRCDLSRAGKDLHKRAQELIQMQVTSGDYRTPAVTFTPSILQKGQPLSDNLVGSLATVKYSSEPQAVHALPEGEPVWGVTSLDNKLYVLRNRTSDQIEVYSIPKYQLARKITVPKLRGQADMASSSKYSCLYLVDCVTKGVHRVEIGGDVTEWPVGDDPWGVSVTAEHNVLIACDEARKLKEFTSRGDLLRQVNLQPDMINPCHAIGITNCQFLVSHGSGSDTIHRVCLINTDGKMIKTYGGAPGAGVGQTNGPRHLAVYKKGFIFVADFNNDRVLVLNGSLELVWEAVSRGKGLRWSPWRLSLDEASSRLYVADNEWKDNKWSSGRVTIFEL